MTSTTGIGFSDIDTISGGYSSVSGLDQLGAGHAMVLHGGVGSAQTILNSFNQQLSWLSKNARITLRALTGQNSYMGRAMDIADEGGSVGAEAALFPMRPPTRFENFFFPPPVVAPATSIEALAASLAATNDADVVAASTTWRNMSNHCAQVAAQLRGVAGQIAAANSGVVFDRAVARINEMATQGEFFAANAQILASDVDKLSMIKAAMLSEVSAALPAIEAITDPVERKAVEQGYLAKMQASLASYVAAAVPKINNLMVNNAALSGGIGTEIGMDAIAGKGRTNTSGLGATGAPVATHSAAAQPGAGNFNAIDAQAAKLNNAEMAHIASNPAATNTHTGAGSATPTSGVAPTSPQGLSSHNAMSTPAMNSALNPVAHSTHGGSELAGHTATRSASSGLGGHSQFGSTTTSHDSHTAHNAKSANRKAALASAGLGLGTLGGVRGAGSLSASGTSGLPQQLAGTSALRAMNMSGSGSGAGSLPAMASNSAPPMQAVAQGRGANMMGGMPMQSAASSAKSNKKPKGIITEVEVDDNIAALIGKREGVVPGVIGAWVRN
ncbi:hypothetical protein EML15_02770 [Corynebacterium sp. sy017]|uniref:hypothetical protein n=1 Tax=unclassified Corynebacterium TaxID=2624378 RepID=UPI001185C93B|nr:MULTISPECIES: hypothetical protein [unclassified Corynebacterium]MBP3088078.1 hypothetical protein [Corynebacterium sp. sy017]TSD92603.1 hypothetical protein ELY17_02770 [Corynebacterium sp. SY003]